MTDRKPGQCTLCEGGVERVFDGVLECYAHVDTDRPGKLRMCADPARALWGLRQHPVSGEILFVPFLQAAVERVQSIVDSLDVSRFPMRMKVSVAVGAMLCVEMAVQDRERPEDTTVVLFSQRIPRLAEDERFAHEFVYSIVKRAVVHELDECWLLGGERVRDPHRR